MPPTGRGGHGGAGETWTKRRFVHIEAAECISVFSSTQVDDQRLRISINQSEGEGHNYRVILSRGVAICKPVPGKIFIQEKNASEEKQRNERKPSKIALKALAGMKPNI
jgi:hypothetical protein